MERPYDVMAPFHASSSERDSSLARLRREDPVHWDPVNQWWLVTRHADVREISRRPELFSSEPRGPWHMFEYHFSMQAMDGERHIRNRNVVSRAFTPRLVSMLTERAERYADEAIDALAGRSSAEFVVLNSTRPSCWSGRLATCAAVMYRPAGTSVTTTGPMKSSRGSWSMAAPSGTK